MANRKIEDISSMDDVLGFILSGGFGTRLYPLTRDRAKSSVPIAANLRIIDFVLTNFVRSGIKKIYVTIYYKSDSLSEHISSKWNFLPRTLGEFIKLLPPQKRTEHETYGGSANAIYQNKHLLEKSDARLVAVFSADQVYYMDIRQLAFYHRKKNADATICALPMKVDEAPREPNGSLSYGVIIADKNNRIIGFEEKPKKPKEIPGKKGYFWAAMGNYMFNKQILYDAIIEDNLDPKSINDFGTNIMPRLVRQKKKIYMYDFSKNKIPNMLDHQKGFWKDIGQIDDYYDANMMLLNNNPKIDLYDSWAIMQPPAKTLHYEAHLNHPGEFTDDHYTRTGYALNSLVALGTIISGARILKCVIGSNARIHSYSSITDSIIFDNVEIGMHCKIKNTIIDKYVIVPDNTIIGHNKKDDIKRGFFISKKGITVIPKGYRFEDKNIKSNRKDKRIKIIKKK